MIRNSEKVTQFKTPKIIINSEKFEYNFYTDLEKTIADDSFNTSESFGNITSQIVSGSYIQTSPRKVSLSLDLKNLKDFNDSKNTNRVSAESLASLHGLQRKLSNLSNKGTIITSQKRKIFFNERINLNRRFFEENNTDLTFDEDLSFMYKELIDALDTEEPNNYVSLIEQNEDFINYSRKMDVYKSESGLKLRESQKLGNVSTKNIDFLTRINNINGNTYLGFLDDKNLLSNKNYLNNIFVQKPSTELEKNLFLSANKTKRKSFVNPSIFFKTAEYVKKINKESNNSLNDEKNFDYNLGFIVGILIDKYSVDEDLNKTYLCSKFKKYDDNNTFNISDEAVKYGKRYIYEACPVHLFLRSRENNGLDFHEFYLVLGNKTTSNIVNIIERQSPDIPTSLLCRYDFNLSGIHLSWGMPNNPQFDIFNFQVFRRESLLEPYRLIKEIRGKDIEVMSDEGFEEPLDEVIDKSGIKFNFLDTEIQHNKIYIYAICAIDAHGMSSALSSQVACKFNRLLSNLEVDTISRGGALKYYPNQFIRRKSKFFDNENSIITNTPVISNKSKLTLYFTPDYKTIKNKNETYEIINIATSLNHTPQTDGHYIINLTDLNTLNSTSQKIYIKD